MKLTSKQFEVSTPALTAALGVWVFAVSFLAVGYFFPDQGRVNNQVASSFQIFDVYTPVSDSLSDLRSLTSAVGDLKNQSFAFINHSRRAVKAPVKSEKVSGVSISAKPKVLAATTPAPAAITTANLQTQLIQLLTKNKQIRALIAGSKGLPGPSGETGPAGPPGAPGPAGPPGFSPIVLKLDGQSAPSVLTGESLVVNGPSTLIGNTTINGVAYSWPASQGGAGTLLSNNGSGTLSWTAAGGSGDNITVNSVAASDANFKDVSATGSIAGVTWSLNTVPTPDDITLAVSVASGVQAGVVDTNPQTFAGAKTFSSQIVATGGVSVGTFAGPTSVFVCSNSGVLSTCNASTTTLQQAYAAGNTISTSGTDLAVTLNSADKMSIASGAAATGGLEITSANTSQTGTSLLVQPTTTGAPTNGLVRFNFNGIRTGAGTAFQIDDISTTLATTMGINANSLTTGNALAISATATGLTGNALSVTTGSTGVPSNGLVRFNFNGIRTAAGVGFQIDDVSTTSATAMKINANSLTSGNALAISATASGLTGNALSVTTGSTSAPTTGLVYFNFNGIRTGAGTAFQVTDISTTSATTMGITANSLTSGNALAISATASGLTGNALSVTTGSTSAPTTGLVYFNFNGIRTGAGTAFQVTDISTTSATTMGITANSLTSGNALAISATASGLTGNALSVTTGSTSAPTTGLVYFNFNGIRTGAGTAFQVTDISTTSATTMGITANSLTSGNALAISATASGLTGNALSVTTGSTGVPSNGLVRFNFNGIRTAAGVGFQIDDVSTTAATAMKINVNSLTTGLGEAIASSATGITSAGSNVGSLLDITESGAMTALTGSLVSINASGANAVGATGNALNINIAGTAQLMHGLTIADASTGALGTTAGTSGAVVFNFSAAHTGWGFDINDATATGVGMVETVNALTSGNGMVIASSATGITSAAVNTGSLLDVTESGAMTALTGSLVSINASGANAVGATGNALNINIAGTAQLMHGLTIADASTGALGTTAGTSGAVVFNFSGAHTGWGFDINDATATGVGMVETVNALTSGNGMVIASSATGITSAAVNTGSLLDVTESGAMTALTGSLVSINASGANAVGATGSALKINIAGTAQLMHGISIVDASTGALGTTAGTSGALAVNMTGAHTGYGVNIADVTTGGTILAISDAAAMTSGSAGIRILMTGVNEAGTTTTTTSGILIAMPSATISTMRYIRFTAADGTTEIGSINNTNSTTIAYATSSDARLKGNIVETHLGLADLLKVGVKDFIWNSSGVADNGFIAQDLYPVYPNAVTKGDNGTDPYVAGVTNTWEVDYGRVTPLIVKAVQDQQGLLGEFTMKDTPGLTTLVEDIQSEIAHNPVTIITNKINSGTMFLTDFVSGRVTAIRGYFDEIFANKSHQKTLCVGDANNGGETCITKSQLDQLLENQNSNVPAPAPTPAPTPTPPPPADPTPTVTPEPTPTPEQDPVVEQAPVTDPVLQAVN